MSKQVEWFGPHCVNLYHQWYYEIKYELQDHLTLSLPQDWVLHYLWTAFF